MGVIIDLNTRRVPERPDAPRPDAQDKSADILVFTGVRYEEKKPAVADQSRTSKG